MNLKALISPWWRMLLSRLAFWLIEASSKRSDFAANLGDGNVITRRGWGTPHPNYPELYIDGDWS